MAVETVDMDDGTGAVGPVEQTEPTRDTPSSVSHRQSEHHDQYTNRRYSDMQGWQQQTEVGGAGLESCTLLGAIRGNETSGCDRANDPDVRGVFAH